VGKRAHQRLFLIHWHAAEARERAARLTRLGYQVTVHSDQQAGTAAPSAKALRSLPFTAVVIDLARLPAHGRAMAGWIREHKGTRALPIVCIEGDAEKTARMRRDFPDVVYTTWAKAGPALTRAIARPPRHPVVPARPDYSGTPLPQKLGIKAGPRVLLLHAPKDFSRTLGKLPAGARTTTRLQGELDVVLLFCRALGELQARFDAAAKCLGHRGGLWVAWPKQAAGVSTDLDGNQVRAVGLRAGLVDNKVCAIDATWSGLRFARRQG